MNNCFWWVERNIPAALGIKKSFMNVEKTAATSWRTARCVSIWISILIANIRLISSICVLIASSSSDTAWFTTECDIGLDKGIANVLLWLWLLFRGRLPGKERIKLSVLRPASSFWIRFYNKKTMKYQYFCNKIIDFQIVKNIRHSNKDFCSQIK